MYSEAHGTRVNMIQLAIELVSGFAIMQRVVVAHVPRT
jgi:hypothetical protein